MDDATTTKVNNQKLEIPVEQNSDLDGSLTHWAGTNHKGVPWNIHQGDALTTLRTLPSEQFNCVITSPPYFWLRDYKVEGQIGMERTVQGYVNAVAEIMDEVYRVLRKDGVLFLNLGDTYYSGKGEPKGPDEKSKKRRFGIRAVDESGGLDVGLKPKSTIGIPWRVAIAMTERKWVLRSPIIWHRKHALPEKKNTDRPRRTYEFIFMLAKSRKYYFDRTPLDNSDVEDMWTIPARPESSNGLNTAPFPDELVERCLAIGCPAGGEVLDPFAGSGTTVRVSITSGRSATGIDLNREFCLYMVKRLRRL